MNERRQTHIELELQNIRTAALEMMRVVSTQLRKVREAMVTFNKGVALEVIHNEKRINGYELMIDKDCENVIALFSPVAIDLRFVLATLKINYALERIGDNVEGMARNVLDLPHEWDAELIRRLELEDAFLLAEEMLSNVMESYAEDNTTLARTVFNKDKTMDARTDRAFKTLADYIRENPGDTIEHSMYLLLIHRKLERIGDLIKNIAEETIFYIEAKVLKHQGGIRGLDDQPQRALP